MRQGRGGKLLKNTLKKKLFCKGSDILRFVLRLDYRRFLFTVVTQAASVTLHEWRAIEPWVLLQWLHQEVLATFLWVDAIIQHLIELFLIISGEVVSTLAYDSPMCLDRIGIGVVIEDTTERGNTVNGTPFPCECSLLITIFIRGENCCLPENKTCRYWPKDRGSAVWITKLTLC